MPDTITTLQTTDKLSPVIRVNSETYIKQNIERGNRAVIVVDRGWIWAGDVQEKKGYITLTRVVWVFRWEAVGFNGVIENPEHPQVYLRPMDHAVKIPLDAEIFRVPVDDDWGLTEGVLANVRNNENANNS